MARSARRPPPAAAPPRKPVRPLLLAGGLGLLWFARFQQGGAEPEAPAWGHWLILAAQLLADIVGAWIVVALAQLGIAVARVALAHLRRDPEGEMP